MRETDRVLIGLTAVALNAPSTYTIAWSKEQHPEQVPILWAGIATSALTVGGAILGEKHHGDKIMWFGLIATIGLFGYVTFIYKPPSSVVGAASSPLNNPSQRGLAIRMNGDTCPLCQQPVMR